MPRAGKERRANCAGRSTGRRTTVDQPAVTSHIVAAALYGRRVKVSSEAAALPLSDGVATSIRNGYRGKCPWSRALAANSGMRRTKKYAFAE
jgi:hypothetical protein